jgi:hypothetical protein
MHITEKDIQEIGEKFKERLRQAATETPSGNSTLTEFQDWMIQHNIYEPAVMELFLDKLGTGTRAGKKNLSSLRKRT